jgi:cyclomaltodextrinase / maltogenic alpha-amylase / neopullulanase
MRVRGWSMAVLATAVVASGSAGFAQTVKVKFRYEPQAVYNRVHFPGTFNGWGPNSAGAISAGAISQADSLESSTGLYVKSISLAFGTYQYKVYRQLSATPSDWSWIADPLNRVVVGSDGNSQMVVDSRLLFELLPYPHTIESGAGGSIFVVKSGLPKLSAGIFTPAGTASPVISAWVDGVPVGSGAVYDTASGIFTYTPPTAIADGIHVFRVGASAGAQSRADSVRFEVRARPVQIVTPSFVTWKSMYVTAGIVIKGDASGPDSALASVTLSVNGSAKSVPVVNGLFADSTQLVEGTNWIRVNSPSGVDSILVTRLVNHAPFGRATAQIASSTITLDASTSTDPDLQALNDFRWLDDPSAPLGLAGKTGVSVTVPSPGAAGEYYYGLIVTDPSGNADTSRGMFTLNPNGTITNPVIASNPAWARKARIYFLFPKAASAGGTLNGAAARIQNIRDLGFNVIWLMPVMKNSSPIDNDNGPGYNITDFYSVAPEYGTDQDMKSFVDQAHALGLRVILDVTPNHSGRNHSWAANARTLKQNSPYWNWYEHTVIPHNDNGLGQSLDTYGFNYYSGFSDQLLNFNWTDPDMRSEMIKVYKYWIAKFGIDGYRFDVYWGPHRRYGEAYMGKPVRDALKHVKPDILLLAEDDGTGSGTEVIYADRVVGGANGGVDAAYDFKLYFNQTRYFGFTPAAVNALHTEIDNGGFHPGENSLYMRFMESQDEDRIAYFYSAGGSLDATTSFQRTMPMASVIFTVPGFPMVWNGQEVGYGYGIVGSIHARNRSVINWNFAGKGLLSPHYQKLANIRGQFPAFTQHKRDSNGDGAVTSSDFPDFIRVGSTNASFYAFARPYQGQNGLTVVNFSGAADSTVVNLTAANTLLFSSGIQPGTQYYLNNLYANTRVTVAGSTLGAVPVSLPAYGSAIYTVSVTPDSVTILNPILEVKSSPTLPRELALEQNYPNPFNPVTTIHYEIPASGIVTLRVYDLLGREVATLADGIMGAGRYAATWNARNDRGAAVGSGVYFYRLTAPGEGGGERVLVRKMIVLK